MKETMVAAGVAALLARAVMAESTGVSMALFDDNFVTFCATG